MGETTATSAPLNSGRYSTEHHRMRKVHGSARSYLCEGGCGSRARDWAMVHGRTGLEPMIDRVPLCRSCHLVYDQSGHRVPHTDEARVRMRAANRRLSPSPEARAKISAALSGRKHTAEHVERQSAATRGQRRSPEARQRMSEAALRRHARERGEV